MNSKKRKKMFGKIEIKNLIIISILILIDQITKYLIRNYLYLQKSIALIPNIFHLTYIENTGIGFGLLQENNTVLIFITIFIVGLLLYYFRYRSENKQSHIALALITAGALSNLIDRIFLNHIIDFIDFRIWPAFNFADAFITIGIIYLIFSILKKEK